MIVKIVQNALALICLLLVFAGCSTKSEELEANIKSLDEQINSVAAPQITFPFWTLGCWSKGSEDPNEPAEILIELPEARILDAVVLMPATYKEHDTYRSFVFPKKFIIELLHADGSKTLIADYSETEYPEPELTPQWFSCESKKETETIRIYVTERREDPSWENKKYIIAFSECYAFAKAQNVALNAKVKFDQSMTRYMSWHSNYLVDGFTYYSPLSPQPDTPGHDMNAYAGNGKIDLYIDLRQQRTINEIHFWPLALSPQHGHVLLNTIGFPRHIHVRIANKEDFSDAIDLFKTNQLLQMPGVGPLMRQVGAETGRYLWITLGESLDNFLGPDPRIMLAEIMCLSYGESVTDGSDITWSSDVEMSQQFFKNRLTDELTPQGNILNVREWLRDLHRRDVWLKQKALIAEELNQINQRNSQLLRAFSYLVPLVTFILMGIFIRLRHREKWRIQEMRDQIASDLHDEVGANLSSVSGSAELLREITTIERKKQDELFDHIIYNSQQTAEEIRMLIRFLERDKFPGELKTNMAKTAAKMLGDTPYEFNVEESTSLDAIAPNRKWDIFLFYKEAVHNIVKHARAKSVVIALKEKNDMAELLVEDDGVGIKRSEEMLLHLRKRAQKIEGKLFVSSEVGSGTRIVLTWKLS